MGWGGVTGSGRRRGGKDGVGVGGDIGGGGNGMQWEGAVDDMSGGCVGWGGRMG